MSTLTYILLLPLLAALALVFVPRNFAVIVRAVTAVSRCSAKDFSPA